ncbi:bifunctional 2-polyprenyl-6-hydroxyphenol methylase/3-demethylubiquinol 3-O-methyltransferase UbiG [Magnetospirillum sp. SS-4]|uniref:class I SAM-dependent methyltransferase n=1 Tax=Magnetospirillum sp. SS-4 TaxID=2681465 RepID=UPI0015748384|nr:class I SAM-dependent methyltransferase [Magnetospirillum sp. SS-4]
MSDPVDRFAFGANWQRYLKGSFTPERAEIARRQLMAFLRLDSLAGRTFLDIGSGSGIHSLGAWQSGAAEVVSFDYDPQSVAATRLLHAAAGSPANWRVMQGSILDEAFCDALGVFDVVYSWGVLHHTGDQWRAFDNAARRMAGGGRFYVALYASEIHIDPSPEEWLDIKRRYNAAGRLGKLRLELWQLWATVLRRDIRNIAALPKLSRDYRHSRGMAMMADIRDWLGGWPMEFSSTAEVLDHAGAHGLAPAAVADGNVNTEFLLVRRSEAAGLGLAVVDAGPAIPVLRAFTDLPERPFFIFGTARGAELLVQRLRRRGGPELAGFIDIERTGRFMGLPVLSVDDFAASWPDDTPVVLSNRHVLPNAERLRGRGRTALWNAHPLVISLNYRGP